ncbi:bifunctional UDP-N-acetylglucosamine diphosphorylase/glucosamine-1-phosphate N-acetyltransferase GlmU [Nocardioides sp. CFH 31398]|uniref:bifunctional UDP-N-acetylglucosamine diphosphorylase/glucosamine-1-phosphate N-acetyltransferase GlmU n=1 Tax=Nocardioides sp. CFH 31398 TaxID=2919579 RepID=UPI001F056B48|nr:bifunctional UDP-N-acetylglucosamine diphosphorylase/glucosamine-1-phosphate N-acetyltransferase GlmU [Nocardioides sp. CFH 31398]MCH1865876.1 bifunctional UDP-N-acetylglucosamine diphosphorylase/glucosamine-1-phosphate N-acetyltransferase GlmU [Nocardioides sp. CFH 31398]
MSDVTVIVLAAGGGTRMRSKTMKMLHRVAGRSMLGHVLAAVEVCGPDRVVAVVGHQREQVEAHLAEIRPEALLAVQETQEGTGHAVRVALDAMADAGHVPTGPVLVALGDTPLLRGESLRVFLEEHRSSGHVLSILSGLLDDPSGYGRVVRAGDGTVEAIVEEKEATAEQRTLREINSGILVFSPEFLLDVVPRIGNDNAKGEYYLTDAVALAREAGLSVGAHPVADPAETQGVNDRAQLAEAGRVMNARILDGWMRRGVTVMDPATTWVEDDVVLEPDATLLPGVQLLGATHVAEDAVVGPDCTLEDCEVGAGARVARAHAQLAVIGPRAQVGPFAYLRPGSTVSEAGKVGTFVETKNSTIGPGAKVPHLSYVGDADIGEGTNIGAGTIVANYDGVAKHRTVVGAHVRTGSNNTFVAPVTIADGAGTGAGTTVREDVPPGALAVSAGPQRTIEGWAERRRPGTKQAEAARAARPDGADGAS